MARQAVPIAARGDRARPHTGARRRDATRAGGPAALLVAVLAAIAFTAWHPAESAGLPRISAKHFESAATCVCHGDQIEDWGKSMHAQAYDDPVYVVDRAQAMAEAGTAIGALCDTCHTPIGTMSGQVARGKELSAPSLEGVTCDFCHQVIGTKDPLGGASQKLKANGRKRAQIRNAASPTHTTAYSEFSTKAEFCGACHRLYHPQTGVVIDSTFDEWRAGPYAAKGVTCQDCHMSLTPGGGPTTGRAAAMAPIRDDIYLMSFVGANVVLSDAQRATANLKAAAKLTLELPDSSRDGSGKASVTITNVGAGHGIPGGAADLRQMWLEVNAVSSDGTRYLLARRQFGRVYRDAKGRSPAGVWAAAAIESEDRIMPGQSVRTSFELEVPSSGRATIEAVLKYRSFPTEIAFKAGVGNPVIEMARAQATIGDVAHNRGPARTIAGIPVTYLIAAAVAAAVILGGLGTFIGLRKRRRVADGPREPFGSDRVV